LEVTGEGVEDKVMHLSSTKCLQVLRGFCDTPVGEVCWSIILYSSLVLEYFVSLGLGLGLGSRLIMPYAYHTRDTRLKDL